MDAHYSYTYTCRLNFGMKEWRMLYYRCFWANHAAKPPNLWWGLYKATKAASYDVVKMASRSSHLKMHNDLLPQGRSSQAVPLRTRPGPPSLAWSVSRRHVESKWRPGPWEKYYLRDAHQQVPLEVTEKHMRFGRPGELPLKEALHIHMTPTEERLNRNTRPEIPGCWMAALRKQETKSKLHHSATSGDTRRWVLHELRWHRKSSAAINSMCSWPVTIFALMKTSAVMPWKFHCRISSPEPKTATERLPNWFHFAKLGPSFPPLKMAGTVAGRDG